MKMQLLSNFWFVGLLIKELKSHFEILILPAIWSHLSVAVLFGALDIILDLWEHQQCG